jgi:hypothetical protein
VFDVFLQFFLENVLDEISPFVDEERFEVVEGFSEGGGIGDEVALAEEGVELLRETLL